MMGGIYVNRDTHDFSFMRESEELLNKGKVVGVFPESRIPKPGEETPLPFKPSAACIALAAQKPVIPVVTDGNYFGKGRAHVLIGKPIDPRDYADPERPEKENIQALTDAMRERIIELERLLDERVNAKA